MTKKDQIEQNARIKNLLADTALKRAQTRTEGVKVLIAFAAVGATLVAAIVNFVR